jgi:hypothetical protein
MEEIEFRTGGLRSIDGSLRVCHGISVAYGRSDLGQICTIRKCKTGGIVEPISRILCLRIVQRWPEDEMHRCDTYFMTDPKCRFDPGPRSKIFL